MAGARAKGFGQNVPWHLYESMARSIITAAKYEADAKIGGAQAIGGGISGGLSGLGANIRASASNGGGGGKGGSDPQARQDRLAAQERDDARADRALDLQERRYAAEEERAKRREAAELEIARGKLLSDQALRASGEAMVAEAMGGEPDEAAAQRSQMAEKFATDAISRGVRGVAAYGPPEAEYDVYAPVRSFVAETFGGDEKSLPARVGRTEGGEEIMVRRGDPSVEVARWSVLGAQLKERLKGADAGERIRLESGIRAAAVKEAIARERLREQRERESGEADARAAAVRNEEWSRRQSEMQAEWDRRYGMGRSDKAPAEARAESDQAMQEEAHAKRMAEQPKGEKAVTPEQREATISAEVRKAEGEIRRLYKERMAQELGDRPKAPDDLMANDDDVASGNAAIEAWDSKRQELLDEMEAEIDAEAARIAAAHGYAGE